MDPAIPMFSIMKIVNILQLSTLRREDSLETLTIKFFKYSG